MTSLGEDALDVCFTGLNPGAMTAYPVGVAWELSRMERRARFTFVCDTMGVLDGVDLPQPSSVVPAGPPTVARVREIAEATDLLVTTAQRLPDSALVSAARDAGVPTAMFQHGLYLPFMKRERGFLLSKARKTIRYLRYATVLAKLHERSAPRYMWEFAQVFLWNRRYRDADIDHQRLNVDKVLLNGEEWRSFHTEKYGYPADVQHVVGYPDFDQLDEIEAEPRADAVCYVAQTLVEHGRLEAEKLTEFLQLLVSKSENRRVIIKLHPASDLDLYAAVAGHSNVELTRDALPHVTHYVGHYSTYLALVPFLSRYLFLWEFPGHPTPGFLKKVAWGVGRRPEELVGFLDSPGEDPGPDAEKLSLLQRYFWRNPNRSPFEEVADALLKMVRSGGHVG